MSRCDGTGYLSYTEPRHCPGCHDCQPEPLDAPSCDACGGTGQRGRFDERPCETCGGKGHVLDCCSSCGVESAELVETGEDNGGSAWLECPDCLRCAGCDGGEPEHDVDGERYCDLCAASLVLLSQRYLAGIPGAPRLPEEWLLTESRVAETMRPAGGAR